MGKANESLSYKGVKFRREPEGALPVAVVWGKRVEATEREVRDALRMQVFGPRLGDGKGLGIKGSGIYATVYEGRPRSLKGHLDGVSDEVKDVLRGSEVFTLFSVQDIGEDGVSTPIDVGPEKTDPIIRALCEAVHDYVLSARAEQREVAKACGKEKV